ncbi:MAG: dephospho-CoA kinase [Rhodospirillales bacterium]|nr:dephospho-CoA kinase [Rhodospirillales bacterium]
MVILGLTGSIGMGKSTAAKDFRSLGVPVHDADATVHDLLSTGGAAVAAVAAAFPGVVTDGAVDRKALGDRVFDKPDELKELEKILHPLVRRREEDFLRDAFARGAALVVLDIPLLFETGGEDRVDAVAVVTAPPQVQRARVLQRPGMSEEKFRAILAHQVPDEEKRRRADFIIETGEGRAASLRTIKNIVKVAGALHGNKWPPQG